MTACNCAITHTNVHSRPSPPTPKKCIFIVDPIVYLQASRPIAWSLSAAGTERTMSYSWEETWAVLLITTAQSWMESSVPVAMKGPVIRLLLLIDCLLYFNAGVFFIDSLASSFCLTPRQIYRRNSPPELMHFYNLTTRAGLLPSSATNTSNHASLLFLGGIWFGWCS